MTDRLCYRCGEADFELHTFRDLGTRVGVRCPKCGEYAYGSNGLMAVRYGPNARFDLEALVLDLQKDEVKA